MVFLGRGAAYRVIRSAGVGLKNPSAFSLAAEKGAGENYAEFQERLESE